MTSASRRTIRIKGAGIAALLVLGLLAAGPASTGSSVGTGRSTDKTMDELFVEVGARVPGFAGTYVDEAGGKLMILATHPTQALARAAKAALVDVLQDRSLIGLKPVALPARYTFAQLKAWHDRVTFDLLSIPGVVFTDIGDVNNRIKVGATRMAGLRSTIQARMSALGVPAEATILEEAAPIHFTSLQTRNRPVVGGLQISYPGFNCTLGFNATRAGVAGFVTNSHCTTTQGGVESTKYGQPDTLITNKIGVETVDPVYRTGGTCPAGKRCRYSDSAFAKYDLGAQFTKGLVAAAPLNSIAWNGTDYFRIIAETSPVIGTQVAKVGRTTGKTIGTVSGQCVNTSVLNSNVFLLCQSKAGFNVQSGDSGSPVVRSEGGGGPADVSLKGLVWGSDATDGWFSSIGNLQRTDELGALATCVAGFTC